MNQGQDHLPQPWTWKITSHDSSQDPFFVEALTAAQAAEIADDNEVYADKVELVSQNRILRAKVAKRRIAA